MESNKKLRYEVKAIGLWAFVKLAFFLNLVVGFMAGLIYAFMVIAMFSFYSNFPLIGYPGLDLGELAPGFLLIILPLVFSFLGGPLLTIIETFAIILYNLFSHFLGGLELTLVVKPQSQSNTAVIETASAVAPSLRPLPPVLPASPPPPISQSSSIPADSSPSPSPSLSPDKTFNDSGRDDDTTSPTPPFPPQQT